MKPIEKVIAIICIIWGLQTYYVEKSMPYEAIITFIALFSVSQGYVKNEVNKIKIKGKVTNNYYLNLKPIFYGIVLIIFVLLIKWCWADLIHIVGKDKIFKEDKSKFNVLILPFNQICKSEGKNYDAGFVIKDRLENISNDLNLNINAHYLNNIKTNDLTYNNAKDLRLYHNADIIIYGNLMTSDCSPSGDQICLNFQLDESYKFDQKSNNNYVKANVDDLKNGQIQEEIESIIFILTTISQIGFSDDIKMSEFLQSQLNEVDISSEISIYIDLADMLLAHNYQSAALGLYFKAQDIIFKNNNITDASQFTIKINVEENLYVTDRINFILEHQGFSNFGIGNAETNINYLENKLKKNPNDTISLIELAKKYIYLGELFYQSGEFCASQTSYEKATHYTKNEISGNKYGYYSSQFGIAKNMIANKEYNKCRNVLLNIETSLGSGADISTNESRNLYALFFELELASKSFDDANKYLKKIENLFLKQDIDKIAKLEYHTRHNQFYTWTAQYYLAVKEHNISLKFLKKAEESIKNMILIDSSNMNFKTYLLGNYHLSGNVYSELNNNLQAEKYYLLLNNISKELQLKNNTSDKFKYQYGGSNYILGKFYYKLFKDKISLSYLNTADSVFLSLQNDSDQLKLILDDIKISKSKLKI